MAFDPTLPLSQRDLIRLEVGDISPDQPVMEDAIYDSLITKYPTSVRRASLDAARILLFYLTRYTRERTGGIEVYGGEWASNYRDALTLYLKNPNLNPINPMPYAGGISKIDAQNNVDDPDTVGVWEGGVRPDSQYYKLRQSFDVL